MSNSIISPTKVEWNSKTYDFSNMDTDELSDMLLMVESEFDAINGQVQAAKAQFHVDQVRADPVWFQAAKHAAQCKKRVAQAITNELRKREKNMELSEHFVDVARKSLHVTSFSAIMAEAQYLSAQV